MSRESNRHVNAIANRLSLRPPQRHALEILDRITELAPPRKERELAATLAAIRHEFSTVTDFEREFPSLCFALATGVGKTRLMGAFISYLHLAHGLNHFFVLAPNLTIYKKLITDFTRNTPKYVFKGLGDFSLEPPIVVTGEDYEKGSGVTTQNVRSLRLPGFELNVVINIFNIAKINSEVRGGKSPRIKRLSEYIGKSYFDYLAELPDLVLIMDESHRYRASAGVRAINDLKPVLGLELTATPFTETSKGAVPFKNVILDYPLGRAMHDGFVKEPAVVTRKNFNPAAMSPEEVERLKLEDGIRLHESVKVELETYARETDNPIVKPFLLIIARDTSHAGQLMHWIRSAEFFQGRYREKVIQVDSSRTGAEEDEMVERLLKVEQTEEPTEIVIHVNMLKEGWDVTNLYTIVPLRAANARILIEQSIGRGLRLPYGHRTGITPVDRLNIIAHDKFQEIIDEANRPGSTIHVQQVILGEEPLAPSTGTVVSQSHLANMLGLQPPRTTATTQVAPSTGEPAFQTPEERKIAQITYEAIRQLANQPARIPSIHHLQRPEVRTELMKEVAAQYRPAQLTLELEGIPLPDLAAIVNQTAEMVMQKSIDIPRILIVPQGEVRSGFHPFSLELKSLNYPAPSEELWIQHLRTSQWEVLAIENGGAEEQCLEDYIVGGLVNFDDISYDDLADLLYDLARQTVRHFLAYLSEEETRRVLRLHQKEIARFIHAQMQEHHWEEMGKPDVEIRKGFTELKPSAFTASTAEPPLDFRLSPPDKSNMAKYLFGGFQRCLYPVQKFHSEAERKLAVILEREAIKWFKPAKGQFQIYYKRGADHPEYQPDFVAEISDAILMLEPKAANQMMDDEVMAKREVAVTWCHHASTHAKSYEGKPWQYLLIPHDAIAENMTLAGLVERFVTLPPFPDSGHTMEFTPDQIQRYSRQMILKEIGGLGQAKLLSSCVLLVGAGALGSPIALYLAAAGVGHLRIADGDRVELSNLHRQILHNTDRLGRLKAESAVETLQSLNPEIQITPIPERVTAESISSLLAGCQVVVDGSDNFATRYLLNEAARTAAIPLVSGAVLGFEGQMATFRHGVDRNAPCYRCLYPILPDPRGAPTCASAGVVGPLPGLVGAWQAMETLKELLDLGAARGYTLHLINLLDGLFHSIQMVKNPHCPVCGEE